MKPHDALDDALVLAQILKPVLVRARERKVWLPVRPVTRRQWPNGQVTHEELRPLKMLASRLPCPYLNPGRFVAGRPLVQGMRVALSAEVNRTHEELIERIVHAGLAYTDAVDPETSLVICNEPEPEHGKGYQANELGVPLVTDADFMRLLDGVVGGTDIEEFTDTTAGRRAVRALLGRARRPQGHPGRERDRQLAQARSCSDCPSIACTPSEVDHVVRNAVEHRLHHHLEHHPRQRGADAAVRPEPERDVAVGCPVEHHLVGPLEFPLVVVGREPADEHLVVAPKLLAAKDGVATHRAAQRLVDRASTGETRRPRCGRARDGR